MAYALADISKPQIRTFSSLSSILIGVGAVFAVFIALFAINYPRT